MAFNTTLKHFTSSQELASIWATGENYLLNQLVLENDVIYRCAIAHTSGATFATDLGAGKWVAVSAAGASGSKNYIENGDFEDNNTTGWSLFNTTIDSTTKIPTGTIVAGAAGFNALSVSGSSPLAGSYSLSVSTAAGVTITTTGYGFISDAFTIDREDQAKVMGFSFYYEAVSGTMNFSGTSSNTFAVYIRDVSGGAWIQPAGVYNLVQSSGSGICSGTFQTTATGTQYQIAVLMINTVSATVSMRFDDFQLGPQKVLAGAAISDWQSYTPTLAGVGTATNVNFKYRRVGDTIQVTGAFQTGTPTAVQFTVSLPYGTIDAAKINENATIGNLTRQTTANQAASVVARTALSTSVVYVGGEYQNVGQLGLTPQNGSSLFGPSEYVTLEFFYPAAGLSSNTVMSQDTDTRVVAVSATQNFAGAAVVSGTTLKWTSNITQTHGTYDSSTGIFTAPVSGFYEVSAIVGWYSSADCQIALSLQKNGSGSDCQFKARNNATNNVCNHLLERLIYLNANENIRVIITVDAGAATYISASDSSAISIKRLSGPATIAASETVAASATRSAADGGQTFASSGVTFRHFTEYYPTDIVDTHGMLTNTASETFATIPVSGIYEVIKTCRYNTASGTGQLQSYILLGGTNQTNTATMDGVILSSSLLETDSVNGQSVTVSYMGRFNAGDVLRFKMIKYQGVDFGMFQDTNSRIQIKRVGN